MADRRVTVAIPTLRRPEQLLAVLDSLTRACDNLPEGFRAPRVLVVDNDPEGSGRAAAHRFGAGPPSVDYVLEPRPGISAARNRAIDEVQDGVLAFIDDDEVAQPGWLGGLLSEMSRSEATLVGGPVLSRLPPAAPRWMVESRVFDRPVPPSGTSHDWLRSGNLAIDLDRIGRTRFDPSFGATGGEDVAFSCRLASEGHLLSWAADAVVVEFVPSERASLEYLRRRERVATTNFYRATASVVGVRAVALRAARTVVFRGVMGLALLVAGTACGHLASRARGLLDLERALGAALSFTRCRAGFVPTD